VREVLSKTFGLRTFKHNQLQAIKSILLNHDTFVLMPTGGGKSLCYQLPAEVLGGVTVVVSPLVSLILDQVTKLNRLGISADHLSGEDCDRQQNIYSQMRSSQPGPTLLYVTPKKLANSGNLTSVLSSLFSASHSGYFRPDYKKLSSLRKNFPQVPFIALTATATPRVRSK